MLFYDKKIDKKLNIKTRGTRKSKDKSHNRYEATPYHDLDLLFDLVKLEKDDHLVDFGSGKGRVCFYSHYLFNAYVTGIEFNEITYQDALINQKRYSYKDKKITFVNERAESYKILNEQNIFFFFNPFSIDIFKKVIYNISLSLKSHPRMIKIILTYPDLDYIKYLLEHTDFLVKDYIESDMKRDKENKFLILVNT